jgi:hypothetical protein
LATTPGWAGIEMKGTESHVSIYHFDTQIRETFYVSGRMIQKGGDAIMIFADVRHHLSRNDAQLALHLIGRASDADYADAEQILRNNGMDALLDDPRLLSGLLEARPAMQASYALMAYVVVRHALLSLEVQDRILADYVASVLMHFGIRDRAARLSENDDQTYDTLVGVSKDVDTTDVRRSFLARAHLGNYALWLSGVFPDYIESRSHRRGGPDLDYYETMGRKGFELAAAHRLANEYGLVRVYASAAENFVVLRIALNNVSDALLFPHYATPDRLLRQVSNDARWRAQG